MDIQEIRQGVEDAYKEVLAVESCNDNDTIQNLGGDSLDGADLVMAIERKFGLRITDEEASRLYQADFAAAVELVASKINAAEKKPQEKTE